MSQTKATKTIVIIGGGPGGSSAATYLAMRGHRVHLIEKEQHPRFHIGESLLPANTEILDELGVTEQVRATSLEKWGAEFNSLEHNAGMRIAFGDGWRSECNQAFQVRRSVFDEILFRNAAKKGVDCHEQTLVQSVVFAKECVEVTAQNKSGQSVQLTADYLIDASGRDTFLSSRLKTKRKNKKHNSVALFGHFTGAKRFEGKREGDVSIFWFQHGWFWFIPLADGTTSVGAVCWPYYLASREVGLEQFLLDTIALNPMLSERLSEAQLQGQVTATGNYSYGSSQSHGDRYLLVGDAYAFIDPVFSSGVYLAMNSGKEAALTLDALFNAPEKQAQLLSAYDKMMQQGPADFSWFIYRMTNPNIRDLFMAPRNVLGAKKAVISVLAGDIFKNKFMRPSLAVFKTVYYIASALNWKRTRAAIKQRAINISDLPTLKVNS